MIFLLNCTLIRTTIRLRRHFMPRQKGRDQIDKFSALVGNRLSVTIQVEYTYTNMKIVSLNSP